MDRTAQPAAKRARRRLGDRYDGRRLRSLSPFYQITPYIMRTRVDAHDYYEDRFDIGRAEAWLKSLRGRSDQEIGFLHLFIAVLVRAISQKPRLNRFVAGKRIYARNEILISLAIMKRMSEDSIETTLKMRFEPEDTIFDVARRVNQAVAANKELEARNETDKTARAFMLCPGFLVTGLVAALRLLDRFGLMPRAVHRASPFHTSAFVTDLGSLGIKPIYHHLYDFGTTSFFLAFGVKERERHIGPEGQLVERKYISIKAVNDERICDGFYYASAFKYIKSLFRSPELLESPPPSVVEDQD